ncbi:molecular chaperone [Nostoc sphaeroides]|uniref:Virulence factor SrfB n=1 Tax=Nostoc sphaeroides CCNUC1 TaxID=2653204 RepID=A0A5P8WKC7_9NOSO|nr:molecular chaperone [Nostoc sphaeroides]QFS52319.1 Virulence factor SrfB [Nostoc sphaeroides CCNUC1]
MPVEIEVLSKFSLQTEKNNPLVLLLPVIELITKGKNIAYISCVTNLVEGTPEELAAEIKKAYKDFKPDVPKPLQGSFRLKPDSCILNQPLAKEVHCTLQVTVQYFDSDSSGNPLGFEPKHIERECYLYSDLFLGFKAKLSALEQQILALNPQSTQPKLPAIDSDLVAKIAAVEQAILLLKAQLNLEETKVNTTEPVNTTQPQKPYPGWLAIDFGTSNSTVTLFDPIQVEIAQLLPKEQQTRLLKRLAEWLGSSATVALPGVEAKDKDKEWKEFIDEISKNLQIDPSKLHEVFQGESQQRCLEAIRQIELCLGRSEQFRRSVSKKLYEIYHEAFRIPTLESQNLIPVLLDIDKGRVEISSELEITSLTPLKVKMGEEAKKNKNIAISQSTSNSSEEIISRFHHSPKRYFGQDREFLVSVDGKEEPIEVNQLIQAAWGHLIELTDDYRKNPSRSFSKGEFQTAVVTYPTIAPPLVRKQVKELVKGLEIRNMKIRNVETAYDEAVAVVMFFLWREFGGYLNIGIESFKTRCHPEDDKWSQNVLVLDIGGGTTDLALIKLTLADITPDFKDDKDRGLGGRYYEITPKLLGSSGHLQLVGELITLRMFRLLKVAIVDCLFTAIATGDLESQKLQDLISNLNPEIVENNPYKQGSLLKYIDKENPQASANAPNYKYALDTAEQVLPTRWKDAPKRLQTFYTLWDYAEAAKLELGEKPPENSSGLTFTLGEDKITELLNQTGIEYKIPGEQNFNNFSVTLNSKQFERAASLVIKDAISIAKGLMESRLKSDDDNQKNSKAEKVDLLILSGKTCNLDMVQREIYEKFSNSDHFVWNKERIIFDAEFTKLATSAGACYAEKMRQLKFSPEDAKSLLRKGANQLRIDVKNLFYYLPCNFKRKTQTSDEFLDVFKAGQELYQISPNDRVAKVRNEWSGIQLTNILYREDYEGAQPQLWGSFDGNNLFKKLKESESTLNEQTFEKIIQIQFEIDSTLNIEILLCRKKPHYLIDDNNGNGIDVTQVKTATNVSAETPALFSSEKLNHGDIAVNVLESAAVNQPDAYHLVFEATKDDTEFKKFHYSSDDNLPPVNGLISEPLPDFPESGKHTFFICDVDTEKNEKKWLRIGELSKPDVTPEFPCQYHVSLDENGMLRLHVGEVPYWEPDSKEKCLLEEGGVFRTELDLQLNEVDKDRDPFCGIH